MVWFQVPRLTPNIFQEDNRLVPFEQDNKGSVGEVVNNKRYGYEIDI